MRKQGYTKVRIDGEVKDLEAGMQVDRYKVHNIELIVDRIKLNKDKEDRFRSSLKLALKMGNGLIFIEDVDLDELVGFSKHLMDPISGISYEEPNPNSFSFNSPYGACPTCNGLGKVNAVDIKKVIPDDTKSINEIAIKPFGEVRDNLTFKQLRLIAKKFEFTFSTPVKDIPEEAMNLILNGGGSLNFRRITKSKNDYVYNLAEEGLLNMLKRW